MVRLGVVSKTNGKLYWVYKQVSAEERRQNDYSDKKNAALDTSARKYNKDFFSKMARDGHILYCSVDDAHFILVADDIPLSGSKEGFNRIMQNRYHIKFASSWEANNSPAVRSLVDTVGEIYVRSRDKDGIFALRASRASRTPPDAWTSSPGKRAARPR